MSNIRGSVDSAVAAANWLTDADLAAVELLRGLADAFDAQPTAMVGEALRKVMLDLGLTPNSLARERVAPTDEVGRYRNLRRVGRRQAS